MKELLAVGVGGFCGAITRYRVSGWVYRVAGGAFPWGTLLVNVVGCLLIGVLMGLIDARHFGSTEQRLFLGMGFLGSLTTFSTFGYETLELMRGSAPLLAFGNVVASVVLGLLAAVAGRALALALT